MKKIAIGLVVFIVAIFASISLALHFIKREITQGLAQQQIHYQQLEVNLLPSPYVSLHKVTWTDNQNRKVEAENVDLQLNFQFLFNGNKGFSQFSFTQAKLWLSGEQNADFNNVNGQVEGYVTWQQSAVSLKDFSLNLTLDKPILFNTKQLTLSIQQGQIQQQTPHQYVMDLQQVQLNGESFEQVKSQIQWQSKQSSDVVLQVINPAQPQSNLNIQIQPQKQGKQIWLQGEHLRAEQWTGILNVPTLLTGAVNLNGTLHLVQNKVQQGSVDLAITQGELQGVNFLQMIQQYVPVNFDAEQIHTQSANTPFDQLSGQLEWDIHQFRLNKLQFKNTLIRVDGTGEGNLQTSQCNIQINVGLNNPNFQSLTLPIQFFDNCYAPRYKVSFNSDLRKGLKELLKSKFR